jgi:hypothetical protein
VQGQQIADMKAEMALQNEIVAQRIAAVATASNNGISALNTALAGLQNTVNGITATYVPAAKMTPNPVADYATMQALAAAVSAFSAKPAAATTSSATGA